MTKNLNRLRQKKIGKNYMISCSKYTSDKARIYIHIKNDEHVHGWDKKLLGTYSIKYALNLYNSTKTVKSVKNLLENTTVKPKLAFGYGFDPDTLKKGITSYKYSHNLNWEIKLYTFKPGLSYKIFPVLAKEMNGYKNEWATIIKKGNTKIKHDYFTTKRKPELVINDINKGLKNIFKKYNPVPLGQ